MWICVSARGWALGTVAALAFSALAVGAQTPSSAARVTGPNTVVMTVGATRITAAQFDALIAGLPTQVRAQAEANKRAVADQYARILALDEAARQRHLDQDPTFQAHLRLARENALANALLEHLAAAAHPSGAAVSAFYQAHHAEFEQVKVRHILITDTQTPHAHSTRTPAEAKALIDRIAAKLKAGQRFSVLAKEYSDDPGSKDKGGELGYIRHGQTVPAFDQVIWSLQPGQVSAPFRSPFGYHVVQVEARKTDPLASVRADIEKALVNQQVRREIQAITAAHPAQLNRSYFGAAAVAAPPAPSSPQH
ncbi:MAG: peptidylprolyl isomerase [Terriglobales bacterium]